MIQWRNRTHNLILAFAKLVLALSVTTAILCIVSHVQGFIIKWQLWEIRIGDGFIGGFRWGVLMRHMSTGLSIQLLDQDPAFPVGDGIAAWIISNYRSWFYVSLYIPLVVFIMLSIFAFLLARRLRLPGVCSCGYDLTGNTSGVCPECGKKIGDK